MRQSQARKTQSLGPSFLQKRQGIRNNYAHSQSDATMKLVDAKLMSAPQLKESVMPRLVDSSSFLPSNHCDYHYEKSIESDR